MGNPDFNSEEMQRYLEEQKKKLEEKLAAMTPEERAEAEKRFAAMKAADDARLDATLEDARRVMEMNTAQEHHVPANPGQYVPSSPTARYCPNCGTKAEKGNFCEYCGTRLK